MKSVRDLAAWQRAMDLAESIYRATNNFPPREIYVLSAQLRKAGLSVPSNIAEGQGRLTAGEWHHFLGQARGSLYEIDTQIELSRRLNFIDEAVASQIFKEIRKAAGPLNGLIAHVGSRRKS